MLVLLTLGAGAGGRAAEPPPSPRAPVTDTYHGVQVVDDYQWLEPADDPRVDAWIRAQNAHADAYLRAMGCFEPVTARVAEILSAPTARYESVRASADRVFAIKFEPPRPQPRLVVMTSVDAPGPERVVLDPLELDPEGGTAIDWYVPSPDGSLVAVSLSRGGSESGDLSIFDTSSGQRVGPVIERVNGGTGGGDVAWTPDGRGLFYTRYPRAGERPDEDLDFFMQVWFHALGTDPSADRYEVGRDFPRIAEVTLDAEPSGPRVIATVQDGDSNRFAFYLREPDGAWRRIAGFGDGAAQITWGPQGTLHVVSRAGAPRGTLLRMQVSDPDVSRAGTLIPEGEDTIVTEFGAPPSVVSTSKGLAVTYQLGGPSVVRAFRHDGTPIAGAPDDEVATVEPVALLPDGDVLIRRESFVEPPAHLRFDPGSARATPTVLRTDAPVDLGASTVVREFATSADGTRVPVNIILPPGFKRDGWGPILVTGYGGYGISLGPSFTPARAVLLEAGVPIAVANLRGGGEFGETWHRAGALTNKQNVFDDFAAVVRHLVNRGYASRDRVAIMGGSNGGLLMGATITQHPGLARVAVSLVGIYDMLRVERSANGSFNIPEFGTVADPEQFRALHAYSPYHYVRDGETYPSVLMLTGANDPRVDPMQSRKMAARLQAAVGAAGTPRPVLVRTSFSTGHGAGQSLREQIEQVGAAYAFILHELSVPCDAPASQ